MFSLTRACCQPRLLLPRSLIIPGSHRASAAAQSTMEEDAFHMGPGTLKISRKELHGGVRAKLVAAMQQALPAEERGILLIKVQAPQPLPCWLACWPAGSCPRCCWLLLRPSGPGACAPRGLLPRCRAERASPCTAPTGRWSSGGCAAGVACGVGWWGLAGLLVGGAAGCGVAGWLVCCGVGWVGLGGRVAGWLGGWVAGWQGR
jgi:hypothetical protein